MSTTIKTRLKEIANHFGLSIRSMEEKCGLSRGNISNMAENGTLGADKLAKIFDTFEDINPIWLIAGKGNMLNTTANKTLYANIPNSIPTRPRIPFPAQAGALTELTQAANFADTERLPVIPTFPDYDFTIPVSGDSMMPEYFPGDELACAKLGSINEVRWGRAHLLDTSRGVVIKEIYDGGDRILCHSVNPNHQDYTIDKSDVYSIYAIVGSTRTT